MKQLLLALAVALVFLMGREATALPTPTAEAAPPGFSVQKTCNSYSMPIGGTVTCTITITGLFAICPCIDNPIILTVAPRDVGNGLNPEYGRAVIQSGSVIGQGAPPMAVDVAVVSNPANGLGQTIQVTCPGGFCDFGGSPFDALVITEVIKGAVGGVVTETMTYPTNPPFPLPPTPPDLLQTVTVLPATVGAAVTCAPNTIVDKSGPAGATNCTATFSDNDIFPTTVASGNVTITLTGATGSVITTTGAPTASFRCGTDTNAPQGCSTVNFSVQSNAPAPAVAAAPAGVAKAVGPLGVQVAFTPDLPQVNAQVVANIVNALNVTPAPAGPIPNTPASLTVSGPATLACGATGNVTATLRDAGGTVVAAPTQVGFNSSLGVIASPSITAAGVATTTLVAPAGGAGGTAQITATSSGLTAQTVVQLTACAVAPATPASLAVAGQASIACGTVGSVTATLRDGAGVLVTTPTQVSFTSSLGTIASPAQTNGGVATTTLAAPATGTGGTALVTATAGALTSQTVVQLATCATAPSTTITQPTVPYVPYIQPIVPYQYAPPVAPYVAPPVAPQQPIINVTVNLPPNAFPQQPAVPVAPPPGSPSVVSAMPGAAPSMFRPPNTGDAGLAAE